MSETPLAELFDALLALPQERRAAFLNEHCADDLSLRAELEALLALSPQAFSYFERLESDISRSAAVELEAAAAPRLRVGQYKASRIIGHGGMGTVYLADRRDGLFEQQVALKLIRLDMEGEGARRRFERERQILAQMRHPNIAQLLDGGVTDDNRPYLVMEWVDGVPLLEYCDHAHLTINARLRLFLQLCSALEHLHRHLVVHRDLKPGNVLVASEGVVKLVDFGIAKLIDEQRVEALTRDDTRVLTPEYAAPEQLTGGPITTATDIYGLGALLYELLSGRRPHGDGTQTPLNYAQSVVHEAPEPPSTVVGRAVEHDSLARLGLSRARARRRITGDLDTLCLVALRKEPARRYASVAELASDIRAYLDGRPIAARGDHLGYRLNKLARRHPTAFAASAAAILVVAGAFVRETALRAEAQRASTLAEQQAHKAQATSQFLRDMLASAKPEQSRGREITVREIVDAAATRLRTDAPSAPEEALVRATVHETLGETYIALGSADTAVHHLEQSLEVRRRLLGSADPETIHAVGALGRARYALGDYQAAEPLLKQALDLSERVHGGESAESMSAISDLASLYWAQGRLEETEPLDLRTLRIREATLGPDHMDTLKSVHNLGVLYYSLGRPAQAEEFLRRAYNAQRRTLGEDHPDTLSSAGNLAAALEKLGRYKRSLELTRRTWSLRDDVLGPEHPDTLRALHNIAGTLRLLGRFTEAERIIRGVLPVQKRLLGDGHRETCASRVELGEILLDEGRVDEARAILEEEVRVQVELFGATHWQARSAVRALARFYAQTNDAEGIDRVIALLRAAYGDVEDAPLVALMSARAAHLRVDDVAAADLFAQALPAYEAELGAHHPHVLRARLEAARTLIALGRSDQAAQIAGAILETARTALENDRHPVARLAGEVLAEAASGGVISAP